MHNKKITWYMFLLLILLASLSNSFAVKETNVFGQKRNALRQRLGIDGKALLFSGVNYQYIDKNFYYLTGLREPMSILLILPIDGDDFLFIPDVSNEDKVRTLSLTSGIARIMPMKDFNDIFSYLYSWQNKIYYPIPTQTDDYSYNLIRSIMNKNPQYALKDLTLILTEMRMVKSPEEIALMKKAIDITAAGLINAIHQAEPGMYEYEIQKIIEDTFFASGAEGLSFASIIGSGPNSVIIHYDQNSRMTEPGDVVVMDVGAQYLGYAGDLTRTMPISGKFTARQKEVYTIVLEAQQLAIEACRPGVTLDDINEIAHEYIGRLGYGEYFYHSIGHSLGLDVHDPWFAGAALVPGEVITIEPGIYIASENLGIRIEDDFLVTEYGCTCLSSSLPKRPDDIERLMQSLFQKESDQRVWKHKANMRR